MDEPLPPPSAHPAQPILASRLLTLTRDKAQQAPSKRLSTDCPAIDDALDGGFGHGHINLISGEPQTGKTALALHALATHLVSGTDDAAAVIDTSGTFDVLSLHEIVLARLQARKDAAWHRRRANQVLDRDWHGAGFAGEGGDVEAEATRALDRVGVIRAFDFVGVAEGVGEVRTKLDEHSRMREGQSGAVQEGWEERMDDTNALKPERGEDPGPAKRRLEVADSDDEDPDEEMLLSGTEGAYDDNDDAPRGESGEAQQPQHQAEVSDPATATAKVSLLIIDNIATALGPLMRNNYVHAHALLTPFMRHLTHLTRQHNLCTLIINSTVPLRGYRDNAPHRKLHHSFPAPQLTPRDPAAGPRSAGDGEENPSVFACNAVKPALGSTFSAAADMHVLMTRVPLGKRDAALALSSQGEGGAAGRVVENATVVEVIADRYGGRVAKWAAVHVDADGRLRSAV